MVAEQSPAEEAGLEPDDLLTRIGDLKIDRPREGVVGVAELDDAPVAIRRRQ